MEHHIFNFLTATVGMIAFLYLVYLYIRQNPNLGGMGALTPPQKGTNLKIESALSLEARKRLYVVGYGEEKFLIATSVDKTELLATLKSEATAAEEPEIEPPAESTILMQQPSGFLERIRYSIQMVLSDRFNRSGGN